MIQAESKIEYKLPPTEHKSPTRTFENPSDKLATMLNNRTHRDLKQMLDP